MVIKKLGACIAFYIHCLLGTKPKRYCLETHQQGSIFPANLQLPDIEIVIPWSKTGDDSTVLGLYAAPVSHSCCGKHRKCVF